MANKTTKQSNVNQRTKNTNVKQNTQGKKRSGGETREREVFRVKNGEQLPLAEERVTYSFWHQMIPFFLAVAAILIAVCFIFTPQCGIFGKWVSRIFYGLFSSVAWIVPVLLMYLAIFWKKDVLKRSLKTKLLVTGIISVVMSMCVFYVSVMQNGTNLPDMSFANVWQMAQKENGFKFGGVFGCYLGWLVFKIFSTVGTPIILLTALTVLAILLFNVEPDRLFGGIKKLILGFFAAVGRLFKGLFEKGRRHGGSKKIYINKPTNKEQAVASEIDQSVFEEEEQTAPPVQKTPKPDAAAVKKNVRQAPVQQNQSKGVQKSTKRPQVDAHVANFGVEEETEAPQKPSEKKGGIDLDVIFTEDDTEQGHKKKLSKKPLSSAMYSSNQSSNSPSVQSDKNEDEGKKQTGTKKLANEKAENNNTPENTVTIENYSDRESSNATIYGSDDPNDVELDNPDTLTIQRVSLMSAVEPGGEIVEDRKYTFPPIEFLQQKPESDEDEDFENECRVTGDKLVEALKSFKVNTRLVNISRGPTVTRYELAPEEGVRVKAIANLSDDIALNLAATGAVRIEAPIVGKAAVGVEIANKNRETVYLRELLENSAFVKAKSPLTTAVGLDVAGDPVYMDIVKMPHILIAGTTGAGKSVCINCIVMSLLYKASPDEVKLIMIDPKKVEFSIYNGLPHLIVPVVSNPKKSAGALIWAVNEMERRYDLIEEAGVRDIAGYNEITKDDPEKEFMPKLVIVIDELADLMMTAPDSVESSICRIAQKGRAAGMHLIIGTQRPSVDVITGLIKANVPSRIAFTVSSQIDSRTIIDIAGAEKLIGRGDMLYSPTGSLKPTRLQGAFVSDAEVDRITKFIRENNASTSYDDNILASIESEAAKCVKSKTKGSGSAIVDEAATASEDNALQDPKFNEAVNVAIEAGKISTSFLQRRLSIGYGRAAKLIDAMEKLGIVSAPDGQRARNVLIAQNEWNEMMMNSSVDDE